MKRLALIAFVGAFAAACSKAPEPAPAPKGPEPKAGWAETFKDCTWGEVKAAGFSIWSFSCPDIKLVGDEALPGFSREIIGEGGKVETYPEIRIFTKEAGASIDAILPQVRAASPGDLSAGCVFKPLEGRQGDYAFAPSPADQPKYDAFLQGKADGPANPCGPLGPSEIGERIFRILDAAPDKVLAISLPSDLPMYDIDTLSAAPEAE